jgi:two-component system, sensor histidine kinase
VTALIDRRDGRWMTTRYVLALAIIALSAIIAHILSENLTARHQGTLEVVNVSGRQRMLSQRTALLAERLARSAEGEDEGRAAALAELKASVDQFEAAHHRLTGAGGGAPLGLEIRNLYFDGPEPLNGLILNHIRALRQIITQAEQGGAADRALTDHVAAQALGPILRRLEEMVASYQKTGERGFQVVRDLGMLALLVTLCTLLAEAFLIFRPMVARVERQIGEIAKMTDELQRVNEGLEEQVRDRTAELEAARDAAVQANRAKSRFLAHAGHDLKQPLEAIGMFTGLLERHIAEVKAQPILRDMRAAQGSMRGLLNSILELSRLESGVITAQMTEAPLGPLLDRLAREFAPQAADKDLRFSALSTSATVHSDPALLERIVRNFLSNALRYTTQGGVAFGCRRRGGLVWIEVHDTGPGIPEADRARIFEEFIQLDRPDRDRSQGIGLGLAIVDRLARLMGHPLSIRARKGGGTVFAVGMRAVGMRTV